MHRFGYTGTSEPCYGRSLLQFQPAIPARTLKQEAFRVMPSAGYSQQDARSAMPSVRCSCAASHNGVP